MELFVNKGKPFLQWAGGKMRLINDIRKRLPDLENMVYVEPFIGGGAIFFYIKNNYNTIRSIINDFNKSLINVYDIIAKDPYRFMESIERLRIEYQKKGNDESYFKKYYYDKRWEYNNIEMDELEHAALFLFLNQTCYNGLYRVNRKNEFNVSAGDFRSGYIFEYENIINVSDCLKDTGIYCGDYAEVLNYLNKGERAFFYLDPPYRKVSRSGFNSYTEVCFDDSEQIRLKNFCKDLDRNGHLWMLSNSDVYKENGDSFFNELYSEFNIESVEVIRCICGVSSMRGKTHELLITNY